MCLSKLWQCPQCPGQAFAVGALTFKGHSAGYSTSTCVCGIDPGEALTSRSPLTLHLGCTYHLLKLAFPSHPGPQSPSALGPLVFAPVVPLLPPFPKDVWGTCHAPALFGASGTQQ